MLAVKIQGPFQTLALGYSRSPSQRRFDAFVVRIVIADIDRLKLCRERNSGVRTFSIEFYQQLSQVFQSNWRDASEVENFAIRFIARSRDQQRVNGVVHISEITQLVSTPNLKRQALNKQPDP